MNPRNRVAATYVARLTSSIRRSWLSSVKKCFMWKGGPGAQGAGESEKLIQREAAWRQAGRDTALSFVRSFAIRGFFDVGPLPLRCGCDGVPAAARRGEENILERRMCAAERADAKLLCEQRAEQRLAQFVVATRRERDAAEAIDRGFALFRHAQC